MDKPTITPETEFPIITETSPEWGSAAKRHKPWDRIIPAEEIESYLNYPYCN